MRASNLTISTDARDALISLLGADRLASRNEVRKLALYALGQKSIGLADVMAVVADASQIGIYGLVDGVFFGRMAGADTEFSKGRAGGLCPRTNVSAGIRTLAYFSKVKS